MSPLKSFQNFFPIHYLLDPIYFCIMIKIEKFTGVESPLAEDLFEIRRKVFVEEQKVSSEDEFDEFEASAQIIFWLFMMIMPVATARWRATEKGIKLERFAVLRRISEIKTLAVKYLLAVLIGCKTL
jgi:hypothetical protein